MWCWVDEVVWSELCPVSHHDVFLELSFWRTVMSYMKRVPLTPSPTRLHVELMLRECRTPTFWHPFSHPLPLQCSIYTQSNWRRRSWPLWMFVALVNAAGYCDAETFHGWWRIQESPSGCGASIFCDRCQNAKLTKIYQTIFLAADLMVYEGALT